MNDGPKTKEEAILLALEWAQGKRSRWTEFLGAEAHPDQRPQTLAAVASADAQEVYKWATLSQVLPTEDQRSVKESIEEFVETVKDLGKVFQPNPNGDWPNLKFSYTNWKDEEHTYVVEPESMEYSDYSPNETGSGSPSRWVINATVLTRDGEQRPGDSRKRTFSIAKMRNIEEVR